MDTLIEPESTPTYPYTSFNLFGGLLAALMPTSLVAICAELAQRIIPSLKPTALIGACFAVALESVILHYIARRECMRRLERFYYFAAEIAVFLVLMRVVATVMLGLVFLEDSVQWWLRSPLAVFDGPFLICIVVGLVVGLIARNIAQRLYELGPQQFESATDKDNHCRLIMQWSTLERERLLQQITGYITGCGILMLIVMSLLVIVEQPDGTVAPLSRRALMAGVVYVVCGFLLYSQARLAFLKTQWRQDGAIVEQRVTRNWNRVSLLLIGGVMLCVGFLPGVGRFNLLEPVGFVFTLVISVFYLIAMGITPFILGVTGFLALIHATILSWFSFPTKPNIWRSNYEPSMIVPDQPLTPLENSSPPFLPALIFWICIAILSGYALWIVLERHPATAYVIAQLKSGAIRRLLMRLRLFYQYLHKTSQRLRKATTAHMKRVVLPQQRLEWNMLRLGQLPPRDVVRYFYRSILHRARRRGIERRKDQTPYEYRTAFADQAPDAREDMSALTEIFVIAEYGARPVTADESMLARTLWQRLRRRLRLTAKKE